MRGVRGFVMVKLLIINYSLGLVSVREAIQVGRIPYKATSG